MHLVSRSQDNTTHRPSSTCFALPAERASPSTRVDMTMQPTNPTHPSRGSNSTSQRKPKVHHHTIHPIYPSNANRCPSAHQSPINLFTSSNAAALSPHFLTFPPLLHNTEPVLPPHSPLVQHRLKTTGMTDVPPFSPIPSASPGQAPQPALTSHPPAARPLCTPRVHVRGGAAARSKMCVVCARSRCLRVVLQGGGRELWMGFRGGLGWCWLGEVHGWVGGMGWDELS